MAMAMGFGTIMIWHNDNWQWHNHAGNDTIMAMAQSLHVTIIAMATLRHFQFQMTTYQSIILELIMVVGL